MGFARDEDGFCRRRGLSRVMGWKRRWDVVRENVEYCLRLRKEMGCNECHSAQHSDFWPLA